MYDIIATGPLFFGSMCYRAHSSGKSLNISHKLLRATVSAFIYIIYITTIYKTKFNISLRIKSCVFTRVNDVTSIHNTTSH